MNKKLFLLILPVCLACCLLFTTCKDEDNDYNKKSVPGIWEKLRNNNLYKMNSDSTGVSIDIGFYGPKNGPFASNGKLPYVVICATSIKSGLNYFGVLNDLIISRTGDKISYDGGSFNVSVVGSGLSISNADTCYVSLLQWDIPYGEKNYDQDITIDINGSYLSLGNNDPEYDFGLAQKKFWSQVKNTAWTKQGSSKPSIGFYEGGKGPLPYALKIESSSGIEYTDYVYFYGGPAYSMQHTTISKDKVTDTLLIKFLFFSDNSSFNFSVSDNGLSLTISNAIGNYYHDGINEINGTYTKTSSDPDYEWPSRDF